MNVTRLLAAAVIAGQVAVVAMIALFIGALVQRRTPGSPSQPSQLVRWARLLAEHSVQVALLFVAASVGGSLYLSQVVGLEPCLLCWWQRIAMYPQLVLLAIAGWRRDHSVMRYILALSVIGMVIALYHIFLQAGVGLLAPCGSSELVSCTTVQLTEFGYVTIPVMSLTGFALLSMLALFSLVRWPKPLGAAGAISVSERA